MTTAAIPPKGEPPRFVENAALLPLGSSLGVGSAKRAIDVVGAGLLVFTLAPLLVLLAVLVRCEGPGPILFRQQRVGQGGRLIHIYKFRSMVLDAEACLAELHSRNEMVDGPLFKLRADPRVTKVGHWMRRFSLDELPQLFNVLAGSMSLVGPRPALPSEVERYSARVKRRLWVTPGLTGLWQVGGRSDLPWDEGLELDLQYVERASVVLDLWILLRTIPAVLFGRGAY